MNDTISRQAAIDAVCSVCGSTDCDGVKIGMYCPEPYAIQSLPSAEIKDKLDEAYISGYTDAESKFRELMKPHWIPVSERLPERDGEYLVSTLGIIYGRTYTQVGEFSTATKSWIVYDSEYGYVPLYDVLAWMPLPEPWKDGEE